MKAFWWFEERAIAGMARPGFNATHWNDFSFEEAVLIGWIGQHSSGSGSLSAFQEHAATYGAKIAKFYAEDAGAFEKELESLLEPEGIYKALGRLAKRTGLLEEFAVLNDRILFHFHPDRLQSDMRFLAEQGVKRIACLTEEQHDAHTLRERFSVCHLPIRDLEAPKLEQVATLAHFIHSAKQAREPIAVHCLAGIGRTSTMLIAAHWYLGEELDTLKQKIALRNPSFVLTGSQAQFLDSLATVARSPV